MSTPATLPKLSCQVQVPRIVGGQCLLTQTASALAFLTEMRAQQTPALPWVACVILGYWGPCVHLLCGELQLMSFPFSCRLLRLDALQGFCVTLWLSCILSCQRARPQDLSSSLESTTELAAAGLVSLGTAGNKSKRWATNSPLTWLMQTWTFMHKSFLKSGHFLSKIQALSWQHL